MKYLFKKGVFLPLLFLAQPIFIEELFSQTVWAPYQRQLWVRTTAVNSVYDSAYVGKYHTTYDDDVRINVGALAFEYGITDRLTVDLQTGFGKLGRVQLIDRYFGTLTSAEQPDKYGIIDSRAGLRYKVIDEYDYESIWVPTISVRLGGIKKGDYDRNPQALGDGANGAEVNIYLGKDFNVWGLGALGEWSYRRREKPVPDDVLYYGALYKRFLDSFIFIVGSRGQIGQGGYAFADPRGTPPLNLIQVDPPSIAPFGQDWYNYYLEHERPAWGRKEIYHNLEVSLGYTDKYGNYYNFFYSHTYSGYNTAILRTFGFLINFPFNL
ncbi:hypothetical protein CH352_05355 [Leptospira hartskeerlii]|uniref:Porin n=1 Tax=Leptospira hartskeerlii TaxID=2023177 RepID=A0A2M9XFU3_9LEPT|nr:hypothetical protein [Leptospira hartskeerlii]PJZ26499.1 hypothetical protein CH357_03100 [Leptospira hartskeerlii]PJZ35018.1 hypothetical protein CH352_05355 [Leptospira hartskeerlii]